MRASLTTRFRFFRIWRRNSDGRFASENAMRSMPKLIARFPKIQFFITTHSPFFLLGMEEIFKENHNLINLPYGNRIEISEFSEMQVAYDLFVSELNS